jgi:hypothetical protein
MKEVNCKQEEKLREAACFGDGHAVRVLLQVICSPGIRATRKLTLGSPGSGVLNWITGPIILKGIM